MGAWHSTAVTFAAICCLTACAQDQPVLQSLDRLPPAAAGAAAPRVNGPVGTTDLPAGAQISYGRALRLTPPSAASLPPGGATSLDFADTDIREVVAQILGSVLHVTYTIDPSVHGTATLHTASPLSNAQLLAALQALLAQNGAALLQSDGVYRVMPTQAAASPVGGVTPAPVGGGSAPGLVGGDVVPLRYAGADDLAKVLQPFVGGARLTADPTRNAILVGGDPSGRTAAVSMIQAFDIDVLTGQSYALLPTNSDDAKDFAAALTDAFRAQPGGALAGQVRVVPMGRLNAVIVVASQPRLIEEARRVYALVERARRATVRGWHVYYLQNSPANDVAYVLQRAFTPNDVTARPTSETSGQTGQAGTGNRPGGLSGQVGGATGVTSVAGTTVNGAAAGAAPSQAGGLSLSQPAANTSANPLLGGLEVPGGLPAANAGGVDVKGMRIIPNPQNNAILTYATQQEEDTIEAMLHKIDILPLQVRIDATIAEVTLNDQLQYGTQFFFKSGGINGVLSTATQSFTAANLASAAFGTTLPGFVIGGNGLSGAPLAISALQAVTTVHVLSSPQLMVLDNRAARLQVGNLVPYLSSTAQSTLTSNPQIVNQVNYQPTGVILEVTPRVNSGGLVTLDISQEVSDVDTTSPKPSGIDSPTFQQRLVTSRIVVQDGQTIGLAGLIRDSAGRSNSGIPWLKDIPLLGALAGSQNNERARTELLVLITPHVLRDQRDGQILTEELRDKLINAAAVPQELQATPSGSSDPNRRIRRSLAGH